MAGNNLLAAKILRDSNTTKGGTNALAEQFPELYGAFKGLLGTAPDEVGGSVLDGSHQAQKAGAEATFVPGLLAELMPTAKATGLLGLATKASGFNKLPAMLGELQSGYEATGVVPKLKNVPLVALSPEEQALYNSARRGNEPKLTSNILNWNGRHQFQSRAAEPPVGNGYPVNELADQLNNLSSQNLKLSTDNLGRPSLQVTTPRTNYAGQQISDNMVIGVDQYGKGEIFSVIPEGDGLRKGQKAPAVPRTPGDRPSR